MSRYRIMLALAGAAAVSCTAQSAVTHTAPSAVTHTAQARAGGAGWGQAIEVPGLAALSATGYAQVYSVSCASVGNCAAGGSYADGSGHSQAFVASHVNGRWGTAIEVPGTAALHARESAEVYSVSCAPAGTCAAGGYYTEGGRLSQGFVVTRS